MVKAVSTLALDISGSGFKALGSIVSLFRAREGYCRTKDHVPLFLAKSIGAEAQISSNP